MRQHPHKPKGMKAMKSKLRKAKEVSVFEMKRAIDAASKALDQQTAELVTMRRILYSERAQIIYYVEKYRSMVAHECLDLTPIGFLDLSEPQQEKYIKLAIAELTGSEGIVAHDAAAAAVEPAQKVSLQ